MGIFGKENNEKDNVGMESKDKVLDALIQQGKSIENLTDSQNKIIERMEQDRIEREELKKEVLDIKKWKEEEARITPSDCGTIAKNCHIAVHKFLSSYDLSYDAWRPLAYPAHNGYINSRFGVSKRADILLKHRDEAFAESEYVHEDFWKVKALLVEARINNNMPMTWTRAERNDFWEVCQLYIYKGVDLNTISNEELLRQTAINGTKKKKRK